MHLAHRDVRETVEEVAEGEIFFTKRSVCQILEIRQTDK